jgi:hypothetical protein
MTGQDQLSLGLSGGWPPNEVQRSHLMQRPKWPILNLGMLFSTKCNVRINLRAMVGPSLNDYAWDVSWATEWQQRYLELPYDKTLKR